VENPGGSRTSTREHNYFFFAFLAFLAVFLAVFLVAFAAFFAFFAMLSSSGFKGLKRDARHAGWSITGAQPRMLIRADSRRAALRCHLGVMALSTARCWFRGLISRSAAGTQQLAGVFMTEISSSLIQNHGSISQAGLRVR
jgi:hypothetical protein